MFEVLTLRSDSVALGACRARQPAASAEPLR